MFTFLYPVVTAFFKLAADVGPFGTFMKTNAADNSFDALSMLGTFLMDTVKSLCDEIMKGVFRKLKETIDPQAELEAEAPKTEEKGKMGKMKDKMLKTLKNVSTNQHKPGTIEIPALNHNILVVRINSLKECLKKSEQFKSTISEECAKLSEIVKDKNPHLCSFFTREPSADSAINLIAAAQMKFEESIPRLVDVLGEKLTMSKMGMIYKRLYFPAASSLNLSNSSFVADLHASVAFLVDTLGNTFLIRIFI